MTEEPIRLRPAVQKFAEQMEKKLRKHDIMKGVTGWLEMSPKELSEELNLQRNSLDQCMDEENLCCDDFPITSFVEGESDKVNFIQHCVDEANLCMMLADRISDESGRSEARARANLFRGKRLDNGDWIIGWLFLDRSEEKLTAYILFRMNYSFVPEAPHPYPIELNIFAYPVDPKTVGRCTGIKASDGTYIYERDVLEATDILGDVIGEPFVVKWDERAGVYPFDAEELAHSYDMTETTSLGWAKQVDINFSILGNIDDHPDWRQKWGRPDEEKEEDGKE